ncbi:MAG: thermonuclease family protein [Planctomycetes bacterium]|nr:thermonuclease family protein [Planctomycetota bacterium]
MRYLRVVVLLFLLLAGACSPEFTANTQTTVKTAPQRATVSARDIKVLDGDTISYKGATVRLMGYDTPEKANAERFKGSQEPYASRAEIKLRDILTGAAKVEIAYLREGDKYGRKLAHVYADGVTIGVALIKAGLAYANVDHFGAQGFDEEAKQLRDAVASSPKPEFEEPFKWRARNTIKSSRDE